MPSDVLESELFDLFPTPLRRVPALVDATTLEALVRELAPRAQRPNAQSEHLTHTAPLKIDDHVRLRELRSAIDPHVVALGELLLGERLHWTIKELWINVLETGGRQGLHNHANSFISGILYLTPSHPSANTVFVKSVGSSDYVFNNTNARAQLGPYNAGKWVAPDPSPGDMLLFPSYLLHEVPPNRGPRRISLAFNAIPHRLDSWGYSLNLSP